MHYYKTKVSPARFRTKRSRDGRCSTDARTLGTRSSNQSTSVCQINICNLQFLHLLCSGYYLLLLSFVAERCIVKLGYISHNISSVTRVYCDKTTEASITMFLLKSMLLVPQTLA